MHPAYEGSEIDGLGYFIQPSSFDDSLGTTYIPQPVTGNGGSLVKLDKDISTPNSTCAPRQSIPPKCTKSFRQLRGTLTRPVRWLLLLRLLVPGVQRFSDLWFAKLVYRDGTRREQVQISGLP